MRLLKCVNSVMFSIVAGNSLRLISSPSLNGRRTDSSTLGASGGLVSSRSAGMHPTRMNSLGVNCGVQAACPTESVMVNENHTISPRLNWAGLHLDMSCTLPSEYSQNVGRSGLGKKLGAESIPVLIHG